jgi:DNA-binding GntR family transcriptional regulator
VSRTPVREALRKLEAARVVVFLPRRGAVIRVPSTKDVRDAYLVRADLEGLAAQLAARWINDDQIDELRRAEELFRRSVRQFVTRKDTTRNAPATDLEWIRANDLFHDVLQNAAGNDLLKKTISDIHRVFPRHLTWLALSRDSHLLASNVDQHQQIREAIERRDSLSARALMTSHVERAGELVVMSIEHPVDVAAIETTVG